MVAFEIIVLFGASFMFGYLVGRTGRTDADKARQSIEDQAIAQGFGEITVANGVRAFRWKK